MVFRFISKAFRGRLCSTSEDAVLMNIKDAEGSFPINATLDSRHYYSSSILTDLEQLSEGADILDDKYPWARQTTQELSSTSTSSPKLTEKQSSSSHPWARLIEEEEGEDGDVGAGAGAAVEQGDSIVIPERKSTVFSNIHLVRSKLFASNQVNVKMSQCSEEEPAIEVEPAIQMHLEQNMNTTNRIPRIAEEDPENHQTVSLQTFNLEAPEEEIVFTKDPIPIPAVAPLLNALMKNTFIMNPPVLEMEIEQCRRRSISNDFSEMSSLSGSRHNIMEFSLETGFDGQAPYMKTVSDDIVRRLEQKATREDRAFESTPLKTNVSPKCLILLMDPKKKIFEIVQVPYQPETTTVGEMLLELPNIATDYRLARQAYTGLAYQGMHICAPMVPVDIILEAESRGKPLFAVPEKYSAGQVELIGNTLLETPKVARLLEEQLERLAASAKKSPPLPTVIHSKNKIPTARSSPHEKSMRFTPSSGRFIKSVD